MKNQQTYLEQKLNHYMDPADLFEALEKRENVIPVDARKPFGFEAERIPFSINLPHRELTPELVQGLDKKAIYVTYCDGIGCNASTKGALKLLKLGFQVKELIGGIEWWKLDGYAVEGSKAKATGIAPNCAC
jgi:rhodanese-related sulfurtransferase